jgi:peptide/nickel transport system substrate-binding protein
MPKDYPAKEAGTAPIGTGPFLRTDYVSGSHIVFSRFVDYFREGLPYLDGLRVEIVRSATIREAAFLTGKLDIELNSFPYSPQNEPILVKKVNNGEVQRQQIRVDVLQGIIFNTADPVFSDKRVRQAAHLAVDRDGLIATVYNNKGKVRVLFVDEPFGRPEAEIRQLPGFRQPKDEDLAEARRLMTEAGYPDGVDVTILTRGDSGSYRRLTEYLAGELAKIGIRAKIDLQDGAVVYDSMGVQEFQLAGMRLSQATAHPDEAIGGYFITGASRDWMNYSNPEVDALYLKISSSTDPVEKKALIRKVEDILLDEVPMVLTADALGDYVWYSYVKGLEFGLSRYHSIQRFESVWLDR